MIEREHPEMTQGKEDEFYVGYLEHAPAAVGKFVARTAGGLLAGAAIAGAAIALGQKMLARAAFEFGNPRTFVGTVTVDPHPAIRIELPGTPEGDPGVTRLMLVSRGKHGARAAVAPHHDRKVVIEGSLIYRDDESILELVPGSIRRLEPAGVESPPLPERQEFGRLTLRGEIVDAKCHLGVMNPGQSTAHRACAIRCLSGGIPAMLAVGNAGGVSNVWLVGADNEALTRAMLPMVAEQVELPGTLFSLDDQLFLEVDPATFTGSQ